MEWNGEEGESLSSISIRSSGSGSGVLHDYDVVGIRNWYLIDFLIMPRALQLHLQAFVAYLEAIHRLDRILRRQRRVVRDEAYNTFAYNCLASHTISISYRDERSIHSTRKSLDS